MQRFLAENIEEIHKFEHKFEKKDLKLAPYLLQDQLFDDDEIEQVSRPIQGFAGVFNGYSGEVTQENRLNDP